MTDEPIGVAADEDVFVTPGSWQRSILPRRGGLPIGYRPGANWATVVAENLAEQAAKLGGSNPRKSLAHRHTPADIRDQGLAHLDGAPDSTPLGAAAVAVTAVGPQDRWSSAVSSAFADSWIATRGLEFAVRAGVELADLRHWGPLERARHAGDVGPAPVNRFGDNPLPYNWDIDGNSLVLFRLRAAMAAASDDDHAAALAALAAARELPLMPHQFAATSFLAPQQHAWVDHDVRAFGKTLNSDWIRLLLSASITDLQQFSLLWANGMRYQLIRSMTRLHTLGEGLGAAGLPLYLELIDQHSGLAEARTLFGLVAAVPSDEAFRLLLDRADDKHVAPALAEAADRFPRRAMRLLATAGNSAVINGFLRTHVVGHRDIADEVSARLPGAAAQRISAITARLDAVREAPAEALPPLLASPPWITARTARKPVVVAGLECVDETTLDWAPGERGDWGRLPSHYGTSRHRDFAALAGQIKAGRVRTWDEISFFVQAPEEMVSPLLSTWRPDDLWDAEDWMRAVVSRFGLAATPVAIDAARRSPSTVAKVLMPFAGPQVALLMAEWFSRLKTVRPVAVAWLQRHPAVAARALVPAALAKPGTVRRYAERALLALAAAGHRDTVEQAAGGYGGAVSAAIVQLLDTDPLELFPAKLPAVPGWADAALLAPIELTGGAGSLPAEAARHVVTMLAMSRIGEPYAGLGVLRQTCAPGSLAEFAWSLFQAWQQAGAPTKESWVLDAVAFLGDDETVRRLAPVIRAWPGEGAHTRAVTGLDVLAEIGTDVALMHLHGISEKVKFKALKERAKEKIAEVAAGLELTPQQLADRLVPDFGLVPDGTLVLDYGPRRFVVGFDEQLKPFVADEDGKRRKDLPKPGAKDDPELAPVAAQRFAALKKDVRTVAADQIRRFEHAMVWQRRWSGAEFRQFIVDHPLVWHVARRLVWATYDASDAVESALRVAEDRTLADLDDETVTIADDARVGVAHPLQLGDSLAAWVEVFADYEILQPFAQLGRDTYAPTDEERDATNLAQFAGVKVPTTKVVGLERRGWRRGEPMDNGVQGWMERDLPGGGLLIVELDPGIVVGEVTTFAEQLLSDVWICGIDEHPWNRKRVHRFGELDPVTMSEIIRDLWEVMQ